MFPKLPGNQNMRVGWRQSLRAGLYEGQLIEDIGISAEKVIRPTLQDLVPSNKISTQFERIAGLLSSIGRDTGKLYSNFKTEIDLQSDLFIGSNLSFAFESSWFTKIEARTILGNVVASIELAKSVNVVKTNLVGTELIDAPSIVRFSIAGWIDDTLSFLTTRYIRQVPRLYDRLSLDINTYSKFDLSSKSLLVYNRGSNADFGWNTVDGKIVIRDGKGYNDITDSAISIFVLVSSSDSKFTISAEYDTEADFDFLYGTVKQGDKVLKTLWSVSGKGALENSYALGEFVGQQVEIEVRFVSDPAMNVGPIVISSISLSG